MRCIEAKLEDDLKWLTMYLLALERSVTVEGRLEGFVTVKMDMVGTGIYIQPSKSGT